MTRILSLLLLIAGVSSARVYPGSAPPEPGDSTPAERRDSLGTTLIMPLGDSITELDWEGGYRSFLYELLSDQGVDFDFVGTKTTNHDDDNLGFAFPEPYWDHEGYNSATITGSTGSAWIWNQNIEAKLAANPPHVVLVLLGTNDLNNGCCSGADVTGQMSAFLDQIWAVDSGIVVILGSPPSVDPGRYAVLNGRITDYVSNLPALVSDKQALGRAIWLADHHAVMNATTDLVGDGIHPSPQGYVKMAQVWFDAIVSGVSLSTGREEGPGALPKAFRLMQNYPNPFNPVTTLRYELPAQSRVTLRVFNVLGEEVALLVDEIQAPGFREIRWDGTNRPSGVFFYKITAGAFGATGKMTLLK